MFKDSVFLDLKTMQFPVPKEKRVLAYAGLRKSGKTKSSEMTIKLDERFVRKAFADILKKTYAALKDVKVEDLYHNTKKEQYRQDLIDLSWQIKADKGAFYFAEEYFNSITSEQLIVCDDIRIIEELQLLIMFGGTAYRIYCPDHIRTLYGWKRDPIIDNDISETELGTLSGHTYKDSTGGGIIYNTRYNDPGYLEDQIAVVLREHFPEAKTSKEYPDLEKMISMDI